MYLHQRQKIDRRRIEDAFFQYAVLKAASWYPLHFDLEHLPLHAATPNTVAHFVEKYHGAFMNLYSGDVNIIYVSSIVKC